MPAPWDDLEALATEVAGGKPGSWGAFLQRLEPALEALSRRVPIGRLKDREDDRRNIVTSFLEKLHNDDFAVLRRYFAAPERPSFRAWIRTVFTRTAIDYQRLHPEFVRKRPGARIQRPGTTGSGPRWRELVSLHSGAAARRPPMTDQQLARQMLDHLDATAGGRHALYRGAVELWLADKDDGDIAAALGLERPEEARKLVRAALAVLRRKFGGESPT